MFLDQAEVYLTDEIRKQTEFFKHAFLSSVA